MAGRVTVGGSPGGGGPRVTLRPEAVTFAGDCALVDAAGTRAAITRHRRPFHRLVDFAAPGVDLAAVPLLGVKSGYLSPELRALPRRQVMALTDGAVIRGLARVGNRFRPRGTWPFDRPGGRPRRPS